MVSSDHVPAVDDCANGNLARASKQREVAVPRAATPETGGDQGSGVQACERARAPVRGWFLGSTWPRRSVLDGPPCAALSGAPVAGSAHRAWRVRAVEAAEVERRERHTAQGLLSRTPAPPGP